MPVMHYALLLTEECIISCDINKQTVKEKQTPQMIRSRICIKRDYRCDFSEWPLTAVSLKLHLYWNK